MRRLKDNDLQTFEKLCGLTQSGVKATMSRFLRQKYDNVTETAKYIVAEGDIPIALVAHMDTVFTAPAEDIFYDRVKNTMWAKQGLGADDRAGIFAIIQLIKKGLRPHIVLTTDEERGAIGASILSATACPFKDLRFMIQLDRRGSNDCVFYECDNQDFVDYIEDFGFVENWGTFSDISVLCPAWKVAGVNLSVGYYDEHSIAETLHIGQLFDTIEKVARILSQEVEKIPHFKYIKMKIQPWYKRLPIKVTEKCKCYKCQKEFASDEVIEVKTANFKWHNYCVNCIVDEVEWCTCCGEAFEKTENSEQLKICEDCYYDNFYAGYRE